MAKRGFKSNKIEDEIAKGYSTCALEYLKNHPELNKTASASASVSVSM